MPLSCACSARFRARVAGTWVDVLLSFDIINGTHISGMRNQETRHWSGWIGTWTIIGNTVFVIFNHTILSGRVWWFRAKNTVITQRQLAEYAQHEHYGKEVTVEVPDAYLSTIEMQLEFV